MQWYGCAVNSIAMLWGSAMSSSSSECLHFDRATRGDDAPVILTLNLAMGRGRPLAGLPGLSGGPRDLWEGF